MAIETRDHKVRKGETLKKIVTGYGFPPASAKGIFAAPYNAALRKNAPDMETLPPGAVLRLPVMSRALLDAMLKALEAVGKITRERHRLGTQLYLDLGKAIAETDSKLRWGGFHRDYFRIRQLQEQAEKPFHDCLRTPTRPPRTVEERLRACEDRRGLAARIFEKLGQQLKAQADREAAGAQLKNKAKEETRALLDQSLGQIEEFGRAVESAKAEVRKARAATF